MAGRELLDLTTSVRFTPSRPYSSGIIQRFDGVLISPQPWFDSKCRYHAFEAHEDEQAILNRQAVGSIPTGRTKFWNCGRMVRRSTFNRDGESSILSSSTNVTICRRRLVARIADLQSADGSSILLAGAMCPVRPMDQDRTLRTFRFGFESRAGYQVYGVVKGTSLSMRTTWV